MTSRSRRDRWVAALALGWLLVAGATAARDWPTEKRLTLQRLQFALLMANALDKTVSPTPEERWQADPEAGYRALAADFKARFGDRFDTAAIERQHAAAQATMRGKRLKILAFSAGSTVVVWWLLWTIRNLLPATPRPR